MCELLGFLPGLLPVPLPAGVVVKVELREVSRSGIGPTGPTVPKEEPAANEDLTRSVERRRGEGEKSQVEIKEEFDAQGGEALVAGPRTERKQRKKRE